MKWLRDLAVGFVGSALAVILDQLGLFEWLLGKPIAPIFSRIFGIGGQLSVLLFLVFGSVILGVTIGTGLLIYYGQRRSNRDDEDDARHSANDSWQWMLQRIERGAKGKTPAAGPHAQHVVRLLRDKVEHDEVQSSELRAIKDRLEKASANAYRHDASLMYDVDELLKVLRRKMAR